MDLDKKIDPQVFKEQTIFTAQLEALEITAKKNSKILKYLVEMKNGDFLKIRELKAVIQEFRG